MGTNRRGFLKMLGFGAAATAATAVVPPSKMPWRAEQERLKADEDLIVQEAKRIDNKRLLELSDRGLISQQAVIEKFDKNDFSFKDYTEVQCSGVLPAHTGVYGYQHIVGT